MNHKARAKAHSFYLQSLNTLSCWAPIMIWPHDPLMYGIDFNITSHGSLRRDKLYSSIVHVLPETQG